jgi:Putative beta-barrel porin-2, OmpL-like. bbp2
MRDMNRTLSSRPRAGAAAVLLLAALLPAIGATAAWAQPPAPAPSAGLSSDPATQLAQAPPPAPPAPPAPMPLTTPAMTGPIAANPNPIKFEAGPIGNVYVSGFASGLALFQSNPLAGDRDNHFDVSNGQVAVQKTDGLVQFYVQAGAYSLPSLGASYIRSDNAINTFYSALPVAYLKLAPNDTFSVSGGKLPTLIGAEYTFTFENMNIERGLLWNLEPAISRGVQGNYTWGPVAFALSLNDGYYSGDYNWLSGSAAWTINSANTLAFAAGGNFDRTSASAVGSANTNPLNNSEIFNLIYTYNAAPWTITPYFQYTHVPSDPVNLIPSGASTYGGAILANYAFNSNWSLAGRAEVVGSTGTVANGAPGLIPGGPGATAWSLTLTPTYQQGIFFGRAEGSFTKAEDSNAGFGFGSSGNATTQVRLLFEVGVVF